MDCTRCKSKNSVLVFICLLCGYEHKRPKGDEDWNELMEEKILKRRKMKLPGSKITI